MICWCVSVLQIHFFPIPLWRMSSAKCRLPFDQILSRCFWTFGADTKLFMNVSSLLPSRDVGPWTGIVPAATILVLIQFSSSSCHITTLWNICWIRPYLDEYGFQMVLLEAWTLHFFLTNSQYIFQNKGGGFKDRSELLWKFMQNGESGLPYQTIWESAITQVDTVHHGLDMVSVTVRS